MTIKGLKGLIREVEKVDKYHDYITVSTSSLLEILKELLFKQLIIVVLLLMVASLTLQIAVHITLEQDKQWTQQHQEYFNERK